MSFLLIVAGPPPSSRARDDRLDTVESRLKAPNGTTSASPPSPGPPTPSRPARCGPTPPLRSGADGTRAALAQRRLHRVPPRSTPPSASPSVATVSSSPRSTPAATTTSSTRSAGSCTSVAASRTGGSSAPRSRSSTAARTLLGDDGSSSSVSIEFNTSITCSPIRSRFGAASCSRRWDSSTSVTSPRPSSRARPQTETRIIPSTWRAIGGAYGQTGPRMDRICDQRPRRWRFNASGLRGGRQKANRASSERGPRGRVDYVTSPASSPASPFQGNSGADQPEEPDDADLHAEWKRPLERPGPLRRSGRGHGGLRRGRARPSPSGSRAVRRGGLRPALPHRRLRQSDPRRLLPLRGHRHPGEARPRDASGGGVDDTFLTYGLNYRPWTRWSSSSTTPTSTRVTTWSGRSSATPSDPDASSRLHRRPRRGLPPRPREPAPADKKKPR